MRKALIIAIIVVSLMLTAVLGFMWYQQTHYFIDGEAYAKNAQELDLREEEISIEHYLAVKTKLPNCSILWNVPFQGGLVSSDTAQLTLTTLNEADIKILSSYFPNLTQIDADACGEYALLEALTEAMPGCEVSYQIDLGSVGVDPNAEGAILEPGSYDYAVLMENLPHLPNVKSLHFPKSELTLEQRAELAESYPDITVTGTVEILGKEYADDTKQLDLSALSSADVAAVAGKLGMLTELAEVELMNGSGNSALTLEDVKTLQENAPNAVFHYVFDFYGNTISTTDAEVKLTGIVADIYFEDNLRLAVSVMETCQRFVLEARGQYDKMWQFITDEALSQIREENRGKTKFVWRVYFGENGSSLTDAEVLRAVYGLTDDNSKDLIFCENVRYLDLGHNEFLDYMDFLSGMTDLEVAILSGAPLKSLDPIAACKNLKFLEIANCIYLPDINALKECTQLEMLNISHTKITDITPLDELNLTHFCTKANSVSDEDIERFVEMHPDCWTTSEGSIDYGEGWRYDEKGDPLEWYSKMVDAFKYPNPYNNVGWYLD